MGRLTTIALIVAGIGAGAGGAIVLGADGEDDRAVPAIRLPGTAPATSARSATPMAVDDGIPTREAQLIARRALERVDGRALSVDTDDGLFEVEVQRPDGAIVEVLLDDERVVAVHEGDGDAVND